MWVLNAILDWFETEAIAWFWIIVGVVVLGFGMWLSDVWTGFIDRTVWNRKKNHD